MTDASFKAQGDKYLKNAQWQKAVDSYTSALARPEVAGSQVLDAVVLGSRRCGQTYFLSLYLSILYFYLILPVAAMHSWATWRTLLSMHDFLFYWILLTRR